MILHVDNYVTISQILDEESSVKVKHIDIRLIFKCFLCRGVIASCYLRWELMLADLMTKARVEKNLHSFMARFASPGESKRKVKIAEESVRTRIQKRVKE